MALRPTRPLVGLLAMAAMWAGASAVSAQVEYTALPPMREVRSDHYTIHTDLDEELTTDLAHRMDGMFGEYSRRLADFTGGEADANLQVYLFQKQGDYAKFTENHFPNTGGIFVAGKENLLAAFLESQGRESLRRTLQHEAFHQFAYNRISGRIPIWLNEGLAQFFEEGLWTGDTLMLGQVPPRRLRQLNADIEAGHLIDFKTMLAMNPLTWSRNLGADAIRGATQYNQAWAMVQFLVQAEDASFRPRLIDWLKRLHAGEESDDAFHDSFSSNIDGFRAHFDHWTPTVKASNEAVLIERQNVLADLLISLHDQGKKFDDFQVFRHAALTGRYQLAYTRGDVHWKTDQKFDVYFCDTDNRPLTSQQLYFAPPHGDAPADIVCQVTQTTRLRTHFYRMGDKWWHESLIEITR